MSVAGQHPDEGVGAMAEDHEVYEAFCALALANALSPDEESRLASHLKECSDCRLLMEDLSRITLEILPVVGAAIHEEQALWSAPEVVDEAAEARLLAAVTPKQTSVPLSFKPRKNSLPYWKRVGPLAAILVLGLGAGAGLMRIYVLKQNQTRPIAIRIEKVSDPSALATLAEAESRLATAEGRNHALEAKIADVTGELQKQATNDQVLQRQLDDDRSRYESLVREKGELTAQLSTATEQAQLLQATNAQHAVDDSARTARLVEVESRMKDLHAALDQKDRALQQDAELLAHDRDIRDLIGARNVYMAEVYDVAETGKTIKPFGRVFYTRDKSLIFYGYDLDQQQHLSKDVVFQGWGAFGQDQNVNLGVFYQDDSKKRWILKFNDAKTLARLNSVFVTIEPKGGSSKPTGKPLLSAYLRLEPNHP